MLTQPDLKHIEKLFDQKFEEKAKFLPSKDDFFTRMDQIMGELQAIREELVLLNGRTSEHTDTLEDHDLRIEKLEKASSATITV